MTVSTENRDAIGTHSYIVAAGFALYPQSTTVIGGSESQLIITDPCIRTDLKITNPGQVDPPIYRYAGSVEFTMNPFTSNHPLCPVNYACYEDMGPRLDLCSIVDGTNMATFDTTTGDYTFTSTDPVNYPPGEYWHWIVGYLGDPIYEPQSELVRNPVQTGVIVKIIVEAPVNTCDSYKITAAQQEQTSFDHYYDG